MEGNGSNGMAQHTLDHSEVHSKRTVNANKLIIGRDGGSGGGGSGGGSVQQCELH